MLRNLKSPETYFQSAFRVQSPWSIKNPNGDDPKQEEILKPVCFVFDFAPTRALRQLSEYGIGLSPNEPNPEKAVEELVSFLPVLAFDNASICFGDLGLFFNLADILSFVVWFLFNPVLEIADFFAEFLGIFLPDNFVLILFRTSGL